MQLFYSQTSPFVRKVMVAAYELGLESRIERIPSGSDRITVYVPIISMPLRHEVTQFYVSLGDPGSLHSSGTGTRSLVTIDHGN